MLFNLYFSKKPKNQKPKNLTMPTMVILDIICNYFK